METKRKSEIKVQAGLDAVGGVRVGMGRATRYRIECVDPQGQVRWVEEFDNLVVNEGLNDSLDKQFKASGFTAAWYVGLTDGTPTVAAGDTMASHAGWAEVTGYSQATRPALSLGSVSGQSVDNSASKAVFSINATVTAGGAFVTTNNTKGGTTGILYGGGAFSQDRALVNGDTLNVQVTLTAAAV